MEHSYTTLSSQTSLHQLLVFFQQDKSTFHFYRFSVLCRQKHFWSFVWIVLDLSPGDSGRATPSAFTFAVWHRDCIAPGKFYCCDHIRCVFRFSTCLWNSKNTSHCHATLGVARPLIVPCSGVENKRTKSVAFGTTSWVCISSDQTNKMLAPAHGFWPPSQNPVSLPAKRHGCYPGAVVLQFTDNFKAFSHRSDKPTAHWKKSNSVSQCTSSKHWWKRPLHLCASVCSGQHKACGWKFWARRCSERNQKTMVAFVQFPGKSNVILP